MPGGDREKQHSAVSNWQKSKTCEQDLPDTCDYRTAREQPGRGLPAFWECPKPGGAVVDGSPWTASIGGRRLTRKERTVVQPVRSF